MGEFGRRVGPLPGRHLPTPTLQHLPQTCRRIMEYPSGREITARYGFTVQFSSRLRGFADTGRLQTP